MVQRHVLYLGEINDTQELAWRRSIAVLEDGAAEPRTLSLFPGDRCEGLLADASIVRPPVPQQIRSRFRESGHFSHDGLTVSRPGTGSSNPSPSSEESPANLTCVSLAIGRLPDIEPSMSLPPGPSAETCAVTLTSFPRMWSN